VGGVVVTGAASGIGQACAEALVADNRRVALWDRAAEVEQVASAMGMSGLRVDVCDGAALAEAVAGANITLDGIDGIVHAAGRVARRAHRRLHRRIVGRRPRREPARTCAAGPVDAAAPSGVRPQGSLTRRNRHLQH
jgi:NAD(P)-dependent dehydrogenase (short-subunit alcohol dehydrogenase family)